MILIGGPVLARAWILPDWFDAVDKAVAYADVEAGFVFCGDPATDADTWQIIRDRSRGRALHEVHVPETRRTDVRDWDQTRYDRMVELRNLVLAAVRNEGPEYYLNLDSDILVPADFIANLLDTAKTKRWNMVGGRCYMSRGVRCPSYGMVDGNGRLNRCDSHGVHEAGVVMACVLMDPAAYHVDYVSHDQGEDAGHAWSARRDGVRIGFDGRSCAKHVMKREDLHRVDPRCGF